MYEQFDYNEGLYRLITNVKEGQDLKHFEHWLPNEKEKFEKKSVPVFLLKNHIFSIREKTLIMVAYLLNLMKIYG
jgi:hypothetical protein